VAELLLSKGEWACGIGAMTLVPEASPQLAQGVFIEGQAQ
jgi:hypothetical protein